MEQRGTTHHGMAHAPSRAGMRRTNAPPAAARHGGAGHAAGTQGTAGSALGRYISGKPNSRASQRHAQAASQAHHSAGHAPGGGGKTTSRALSRYIAGKPGSKAAQRFAQSGASAKFGASTHAGGQRTGLAGVAQSHRIGLQGGKRATNAAAAGQSRLSKLSALARKYPNSLPAQRLAQLQANKTAGLSGSQRLRPWPPWRDPARGGGPYDNRADLVDANINADAPDNVNAGSADQSGADAGPQGLTSGGGPLSIDWQDPTDLNTAIGQPGAGVFVVERTGDDGHSLPVLVGIAPDGFGRRLEYVMDDFAETEGATVQLGVMPVRNNHPADRTFLRAVGHDIVDRIRQSGADGMLTNQSAPSDREKRLLEQRPVEHGGQIPDYIGT